MKTNFNLMGETVFLGESLNAFCRDKRVEEFAQNFIDTIRTEYSPAYGDKRSFVLAKLEQDYGATGIENFFNIEEDDDSEFLKDY